MGDDLGFNLRLNHLAEQSWEWTPDGDGTCWLARLHPTKRTELRYFVETAPLLRTRDQLRSQVERRTAQGWEPLGTVNGMDVYRSAPCRSPEPPQRTRTAAPCVRSLLLALAAALLCLMWPHPGAEWYLSDISALLWLSRFIVAPIGIIWAIWRLFRCFLPAKRSAPVPVVVLRGVLAGLLWLWLLILSGALVLTLLPLPWAAGLLSLGVLFRLGAALEPPDDQHPARWRPHAEARLTICCLEAVLLLAIGLNRLGIANSVHFYGTNLEQAQRFVRVQDLDTDAGEVLSAEYRRGASLLAAKESYTETAEGLVVDCVRYRIALPGLRRAVRARLERFDHVVVVEQGRELMLLYSSQPLKSDPTERMNTLLK